MEYLLKSVLISSVIYLFYKLFLAKETFFQSIRWYFIAGILMSVLLPLLIIPIYVEVAPLIQPEFTPINELIQQQIIQPEFNHQMQLEKPFDWFELVTIIYSIGVVLLGLKFLFELLSLMRLINMSPKEKIGKYHFVATATKSSPFSFFNYIVYNKAQFSASEINDIMAHEKVHVNQKHSIDNLLVQLFVIIQWINPFAWMYKKDLLQNLEYIADKVAQNKAVSHKKYQYLLLKSNIKNNPFALSNNFFNSHLKKRIMMLQKSQTKKLNQLKYTLLLPLIALFLYAFNTKEIQVVKGEKQEVKNIVIDVSHGGKDSGAINTNLSEKEIVLQLAKIIQKKYNGSAKLIFTRDNDEFISLNDRIERVNTVNPDLLISLHLNSSNNSIDNGIIAYVSKNNVQIEKSKKLASLLLSNFSNTDFNIKGVFEGNLKLLSNVNVPSVILEIGYITNTVDAKYINSLKGKNEIAQAIINTIDNKVVTENTSPKFVIPIHKSNIKSVIGFGERTNPITKIKNLHKGLDFIAYKDMDVYAVADGEVIRTGFDKEKGNFIEIIHGNDFQTNYQHLGNIQVGKGEKVASGEIIGIVGSTGKSIAPHLHFEILKNGQYVNPKNFLVFSLIKKDILLINAKTTQNEIDNINRQFENKDSRIKFDKVRRNKKGQIVALVIKTNFDNQNKFFKRIGIESLDNSTIKNLKVEAINKTFKVWIGNTKDFSIISKDGIQLFGQDHSISNNSSAQGVKNKVETQNNKNQYRVKKGDTFYSIAKKFNMDVEELQKLNSGLKGRLIEGVYLFIKVKKPQEVNVLNSDKYTVISSFSEAEYYPENTDEEVIKSLKTGNNDFIQYNNKSYIYSEKNDKVLFFNRFGEQVNLELSNVLLVKLNKDKNTKYILKNKFKSTFEFDEFSIVIDKSKSDEELNSIKKILKKYDANMEVSKLKRNFSGNITSILIEVYWKNTSVMYEYTESTVVIKPIKIILDNKNNKARIVLMNQFEKNKLKAPNTQVSVEINKQTTTEELKAFKELYANLGADLKITNIKRNNNNEIIGIKVVSKIKSNSNKNKNIFVIGESQPIKPFNIVFDESLNMIVIKYK